MSVGVQYSIADFGELRVCFKAICVKKWDIQASRMKPIAACIFLDAEICKYMYVSRLYFCRYMQPLADGGQEDKVLASGSESRWFESSNRRSSSRD